MPKVSVIMPVYNGEKYLREAIESILNQTFTDFEFIIINDASKDSTEEIIMSYADDRIVYLKNEQNLGVAGTLNRGLEAARGEYIARIDADDIAMPERFEKQVAFMDAHPEVGVLGTDIIMFGEDFEEREFIFSHEKEDLKAELFLKSPIAHPTVMIRNNILKMHSLKYTEKYNGFEDFALWWDIAKHGDIAVLPECLVKYRQHMGQVTKKHKSYYDNVYRDFFDERMSVFGDEFKDGSEGLLYRYCTSTYSNFRENEMIELIEYLKKLRLKNKELKIFNTRSFKKATTGVLSRVINSSNETQKIKGKTMCKAVESGVFLKDAYLKTLLRRTLHKYIGVN